MNILVLYSRVPNYFVEGLKAFIVDFPNSKILLVGYRSSQEAPFQYEHNSAITFIYSDEFFKDASFQLLKKFNPDAIFVSGWSDKRYWKICKDYHTNVPIIMGMDNPWKGTVKQRLGAIYSQLFLKKVVKKIWVAGRFQYEFARKLGFLPNEIQEGLYSGNSNLFKTVERSNRDKTILYVGRLVKYKRPDWLLRAYNEILDENSKFSDWRLKIIGNGELSKNLEENLRHKAQVLTFMDQDSLSKEFSTSSIFCLPSNLEHWGVVVHEAALSGLPMLLADNCGAATDFLLNGYNGFLFKSDCFENFKEKLLALMSLSSENLEQFSKNSIVLSKRQNLKIWSATFKDLLSSN